VDYETTRSRGINQAKYIAEELGFYYAEGKIFQSNGGYFGNAVVSRYPIVSSKNHILPNPMGHELRAALECQIDMDGAILNFFSTHLDVRDPDSRTAQAVELARLASKLRGPTIIAGDFNAFAGKVELREFMQALRLASANLSDAPTFPSRSPRWQLDFILHSPEIRVTHFEVAKGIRLSDHLPLICDFDVARPAALPAGA